MKNNRDYIEALTTTVSADVQAGEMGSGLAFKIVLDRVASSLLGFLAYQIIGRK